MSERIKEAARMAILGLDPFRYLESRDVHERVLMSALFNEMIEQQDLMHENLATHIANKVNLLFK